MRPALLVQTAALPLTGSMSLGRTGCNGTHLPGCWDDGMSSAWHVGREHAVTTPHCLAVLMSSHPSDTRGIWGLGRLAQQGAQSSDSTVSVSTLSGWTFGASSSSQHLGPWDSETLKEIKIPHSHLLGPSRHHSPQIALF